MSRIRSAVTCLALGFLTAIGAAHAAPAVSTAVAFSLTSTAGNLTKGADGAFYGTGNPVTSVAGGIIWRATADGSEVRTLYQLNPETDAVTPGGGLLLASDGLFYGTTKFGKGTDSTGSGTIFKIAPNGTGFAIIHRFAPVTSTNTDFNAVNTNGAYPEAELIEGHDGMLYGVARAGGENGTGTIFRIQRDGTGFQVLRVLDKNTAAANAGFLVNGDGAAPTGQLLQDADGFLYGTASGGGANGRGTVFRLAADGTGFQVLHHFTTPTTTNGVSKNADGIAPFAGLTDGADGYLYGVASQAGPNGFGSIYSIKLADLSFSVLFGFSNSDGSRPVAELTRGTDGKLYGTTASGGEVSGNTSTQGTFFSIDGTGSNFATLHDFEAKDGTAPSSRVIQQADGVFYGLAGSSGNCGYGTLWRYSAAGDTVTGNTKCGQKKNDQNGGGGGVGFVLLALLGGLGLYRRRAG
jgi:MYXO-CTERM domain-containing protein